MVDLDLTHDVAWEFVDEVNISGDGVVGKVLRDGLSDLLWGERGLTPGKWTRRGLAMLL